MVEDDQVTQELLSAYFVNAGYQTVIASNGEEMWEILSNNEIDLILMDINLPGEDGLSLTKSIRAKYDSNIWIIIVTTRNTDTDRIIGLELGADDYITKPFHERELLVRVKNILRRTSKKIILKDDEPQVHVFHGWKFNIELRQLISPTEDHVHLTNGEFLLLAAFVNSPNQVINRNQLLNEVSSRMWIPMDRTIDVMVNRLRKKIEASPKIPEILLTVHGIGYQLITGE
ncbi:MAG: response regulator [Magnetococcales bacterium]|nr:response regulator [Magnetococcales bacterium]